MSWAEDDWTVGLSGRVLQKVKELQVHQERLSRENRQKQLQLDNIHTSLEKQTVKYDGVRGELQCLQRELQGVREEAKVAVTTNERLIQELQTKQSQVCSLEGQVDSARTLNNKLSQEVKRLETELEKLQNSSRSADTTLYSTPCWNNTSPWEHNESKMEERSGHRDERQSGALHIRRLQFSEVGSASASRKQHKNTPHRHWFNQSDIFSTPLAVFPWERDDSRPAARRLSPNSPQTPSTVISQGHLDQSIGGKEKDHRTETDFHPAASLSEASRVTVLEEELCAKATMLKSLQGQIVQTQKELRTKELSHQKACDELNLAHARIAQESERTSGAEQRLKHLQEELKCQRQNAESSRLQHQQRTKELEKQHQRDMTEFQRERQCLEKQHQQEVKKLNQELQQARTLQNALQAQADKLSLQKQALGKECDILKEKLKCTEGQLQESHKKEAQTQARLMEALHEVEGVTLSLDQSRKREQALEVEGRRLAEEQAGALRLIEQLQEQRAVPITPLQPVLFGPVGQSFSPQPSYSFHSHTSTRINKPSATTLAEQRQENVDVDKRRAEIVASYPSGREPKGGIDTEHLTELLSPDSECLQRGGHRSNEGDNTTRTEAIESDSSGTNKCTTFDQVFSSSSYSAVGADQCTFKLSKASEELKRENATLRSELHGVREELQKRLDDLEVQRQAETEARTRLKQLSRQRAGQAVEKNDQDKEWRARLESERAETERLRKAMAALEMEMNRRREECERKEQEEDKSKVLEDRESEMTELNIQLKTQLAEVKAQLALEREERTREEVERNQKANTVAEQLSMKVKELKAELEELKRSREDDSQEEEKVVDTNSPLTYLTLHDEELNFNIICNKNKLFPSPEQPFLLCQSTNQQNMLVSHATADLIQEERAKTDPESSPLSNEGQVATALEEDRQNYLEGSSPSGHILKVEPVSSDMTTEILRLQKENIKETERANQYQVKLEALQSQVNCQTKHLTTAFEKQRQHISGLLAELQDKESALLIQGEELQRYKQELDALKTKKGEEMMVEEEDDHGDQTEAMPNQMSMGISGLHLNQKNKCLVTMLTTESLPDGNSAAQRDVGQLEFVTSDAERPKSICDKSDNEDLWSEEQHPGSQATTLNINNSSVMGETEVSQDGRTADVAAEVFIHQQENALLKQTKEGLTVSATRIPSLYTDNENQNDSDERIKNTGNAPLPCLVEQKSTRVLNDITGAQMEDGRTAKAEELPVNSLQQQVEELQRMLQALSAEKQQQDEELVMWRLVSQPAPTFDQFLPNTDTQNQITAVTQYQSNQQQTEETAQSQVQAPHLGVQGSPSNVTIVREDELFLSCSSKKLQGCMLLSRLQHSSLPEHKSLHSCKKAAPLQEYNHTVQEAEKENHNILLLHQSDPRQIKLKAKRNTDVTQISSEKTSQPHADKVSIPQQTKSTQCYAGSPETSRATSETNTLSYSSDNDVSTEMKSVSSQTEESLCTRRAQMISELHCAYTQTEEEDEDKLVESSFFSPVPIPEGDKVLFSGSFPIPADPARLAERIRRNRTQLSAAFDDTEYEPYGLPEVVMKGFADIPSGPSCPYIVRRGLLGTTVVPQKDPRQEEETD